MSVAVGLKPRPKTLYPQVPEVFDLVMVWPPANVIVGNTESITVTIWFAVVLFPLISVAVQVTVVVPIGKIVGALFETTVPEQLSSITGVPKLTPVNEHVAVTCKIRSAGATKVGKIVSITVTVKLHVWERLSTSVIV